MGTISERLKKRISKIKRQKTIPISDLYEAVKQIKKGKKTAKTLGQLADLHPIHAVYVAAHNLVSYLAESLSVFPELDEHSSMIMKAQDEYMPQGPPASPLTKSYFTSWAFFDVQFGKDKETIGTCLQDIGPDLDIPFDYLEIIRLMQESRMGIHEHKGSDGTYVYLAELFSNKENKCLVPAGYMGEENQLWYVRILPSPFKKTHESLVLTTPYVLISHNKSRWIEFLERSIVKTGIVDPILAFETFMKYGLSKNYWNEFILQAYYNSVASAIFLEGFPDVPESLPHSGKYTRERADILE